MARTHAPVLTFKPLATLVALLAAALLCTACSYDEPLEMGEPQNAGDASTTWTVLMYLCGSDLESESGLATDNLAELTNSQLGDNVQFIVETGGASEWQNDIVSPQALERYVASSEGLELVDEQPLASMSEASTLADFISWGTKNYPADRTMLVVWDHGGGSLTGVCVDELYLNEDDEDVETINLPELAKALKEANHHFDVIGFDTCLMATLETAQTVQPWADYLVASEESEPGGGWAYDAWPAWISQYPGMDIAEFARGICDSYLYKCESTWTEDMATLSVTDLSKIPALAKAFDAASAELFNATSDTEAMRLLAQGAARAENYGGNTDAEGYTDMVDLGDLMRNTEDVLSNHTDKVIKALEEAVVYKVNGWGREKSSGLSVFYPLAMDDKAFKRYEEVTDAITGNVSYLQYLAVKNGNYDEINWSKKGVSKEEQAEAEPLTTNDFDIKFKQSIDSDYRLRLAFTKGFDAVASVRFELCFWDEEDSLYMPLGTDNNINSDWDKGVFTDNFEGTWMAIDGNFVNAQLVNENENYNLYAIPVKINGSRSNLLAAWRYSESRFEILGAYDGIDQVNGMSGKSMRKLKEGDQVAFLFDAYDIETDDGEEIELATITWNNDLVMEDIELGDGDYLYRYEIEDIFGNVTYSDNVIMHYEDGMIEPQEL